MEHHFVVISAETYFVSILGTLRFNGEPLGTLNSYSSFIEVPVALAWVPFCVVKCVNFEVKIILLFHEDLSLCHVLHVEVSFCFCFLLVFQKRILLLFLD